MAARLVKNISDDYLSCPICLLRFDNPRKLPCEHTFCSECLQKHIDITIKKRGNSVKFACPLCRSEITQPENTTNIRQWATRFSPDNLIRDLLETLSVHENTQQSNHTNSLDDKCQIHTKYNQDIFCMHHGNLICSQCVGTDHNLPNCECLTIEEAFNKLQPNLTDIRRKLEEQVVKLERCSQVDTEFNRRKIDALRKVDSLEDRLDQFYHRCKQQLSIQRSDVERINRDHIEQRKDFYFLAAELLETQSKLESFVENSDKKGIICEISDLDKSVKGTEDKLRHFYFEAPADKVSFIINKDLDKFLHSFSAVGFIDKTSQRSALDEIASDSPRPRLPTSLKTILNRK